MKFQLFVLCCCALQTIYGFKFPGEIIYPPDVTAGRIVGGQNAPDAEFKYQCSLQMNKDHYCGCSIISNKWLLTAAHCVANFSPRDVEVLVGTNDLKQGGEYYQVDEFYKHDEHNYPMYANDIALVRVQGTIEFNDRVQPIELLTEDIEDGEKVTLTGWGYLNTRRTQPRMLQMIELKSLTTKSCRKSTLSRYAQVHESHMCTFTRVGEGACNGDSGGPLVLNKDGKKVQVGVVNFGLPCARGVPDAYAKVAYFHSWIKDHTN